MNQAHIEDLLDRYLKQETSIAENHFVEEWLLKNGHPDSEWENMDRSSKDQWLSNVLTNIKDTIAVKEPQVIQIRKNLWYKIAGVAAVLMIFMSIYLSWPQLEQRNLSSALTTITVPDHQKKQITLSDGSKVWLNGGAVLKYPKVFDGKSRTIYLSGEAYFDIQHEENKPFLIHTGKVLTTVLGTAFNIKEGNHSVEITVTRGKVKVEDEGKLLGILTRNQQISFNISTKTAVEKIVDVQSVIAWQDTDLLFDDITFAEAAIQLQQHFHVHISFSNEQLKNCRFSGSALKGDDLKKILKVICAFNQATWQTKPDGSILIDGPGC